jgi:hypothetical protein
LFFPSLLDIFPAIIQSEAGMSSAAQKKALGDYRKRLAQRGVARFEVLGRDVDRDLIRALARRLAEGGPEAPALRDAIRRTIESDRVERGGILAALRRSPLVGAELGLERPRVAGRKVAL